VSVRFFVRESCRHIDAPRPRRTTRPTRVSRSSCRSVRGNKQDSRRSIRSGSSLSQARVRARALPAALSSPSDAVRFFPAPICQPSDSFFPSLSLPFLPFLFPIPRHAAFLLTRVAKFFNDRSIVPRRAPAPRRGKLSLRLNDFPGKRHG